MSAPSGQGMKTSRKNGGQSFALAGRQFGDAAAGHGQTGDHLNVEGIDPQGPAGGLADQGEDLDLEPERPRIGCILTAHFVPDRSGPFADIGIGQIRLMASLDLIDNRRIFPKIDLDGIADRPAYFLYEHSEDLLLSWMEKDGEEEVRPGAGRGRAACRGREVRSWRRGRTPRPEPGRGLKGRRRTTAEARRAKEKEPPGG